ncbi:MAG: hypothetical protein KIT80_22465 [Chitinophagaceae bacterium]|nr:hypothetical protein [Chitinophagaceae bacterium]MCW5929700.1 hypothetical protein [Chitinophagaceae bacterium]
MGTWGTNIKENDTSGDIYDSFFELYNAGQNPVDISAKLISDNTELIENPDDCNNFWFALALAQWETKSLDPHILEKVKTIIESGGDLGIWKGLDADKKDIENRKVDLQNFLTKIQTEKAKAKPRAKEKNVKPIFAVGDCLTFVHENGNYGGIIILGEINDSETGFNLVAGTRINQPNKPTVKDFKDAEILIRNYANWKDDAIIVWTYPDSFKKMFANFFELIGKIKVDREYSTEGNKFGYVADWRITKLAANLQFEHEKTNPKPIKKIMVAELTTKNKWWKFW